MSVKENFTAGRFVGTGIREGAPLGGGDFERGIEGGREGVRVLEEVRDWEGVRGRVAVAVDVEVRVGVL